MTRHKISTLTAWLFIFLFAVSENSYAFEWQDLWQTKEQQAQQEYLNGNYQQAAEQFTDPAWQAAARYKEDKALSEEEQLLPATTGTGFYNQGNVLAKSGQLEQAIKSYDQALQLNPDNKDAQFNKELVEKALEQQKQQQEQQQDKNQQQQDKQDQEKDQSGDQQEQQNQQGEQSQEQSGEQEQQDSQQQDPADQQQQQDSANETDKEQEQQDMQSEKSEADKQENPTEEEPESSQVNEESAENSEQQQASEQWLKRIPDDPSGLLKRKFKYQYGRQQQPQNNGQQW